MSIFIYNNNFLSSKDHNNLLYWLSEMKDFKENTDYTNTEIIRHQKWYHVTGEYFCPNWKFRYSRWESHEYNEILFKIQNKVQNYLNSQNLNVNLNSCLINKYRNGKDKIAAHRDTRKSFGITPTVAGLSIGGERTIKFVKVIDEDKNNCKRDKLNSNLDFERKLEDNSLFVMSGRSQLDYTHEIPESDSIETRYSLTFREFKV